LNDHGKLLMTILVTGATGTIGTQVVAQLRARNVQFRALVRDPGKAKLPTGVDVVRGEFLDVDAMRAALKGVSTVFLLNAVVPDELTQALIALNLAREAGVERIVYLSVMNSDLYTNVPHFAGKYAVERMIERLGLHATILRPGYFMQNDLRLRDAIVAHGIYPMPIGDKGVAMVDVRDIGEVAAIELLRGERGSGVLPLGRIDLAGPDFLTGSSIAAIWSEVSGRPVAYAGNDIDPFEQTMRSFAPNWMAYDMRMMIERFQKDGLSARPGDTQRLTAMLGRPLRSYGEFASEMLDQSRE
jgi:uncharacterized protein YbjT (DUF2867 family)